MYNLMVCFFRNFLRIVLLNFESMTSSSCGLLSRPLCDKVLTVQVVMITWPTAV